MVSDEALIGSCYLHSLAYLLVTQKGSVSLSPCVSRCVLTLICHLELKLLLEMPAQHMTLKDDSQDK